MPLRMDRRFPAECDRALYRRADAKGRRSDVAGSRGARRLAVRPTACRQLTSPAECPTPGEGPINRVNSIPAARAVCRPEAADEPVVMSAAAVGVRTAIVRIVVHHDARFHGLDSRMRARAAGERAPRINADIIGYCTAEARRRAPADAGADPRQRV